MMEKNLVFEMSRLINVNGEETYAELTIYFDGQTIHVEPNFEGDYLDLALDATVKALSIVTKKTFEVDYVDDSFEITSGGTTVHIGDIADTKSAIRYLVGIYGFDITFVTVRHTEDEWF